MNFPTSFCVILFLGLFIASVVMQWIRAKKRQQLVRMVDPQILDAGDQSKWLSINNSFDFLFKDFRKLQILKRNSEKFADDIRVKLGHYRKFSKAEILVTLSMFLFGSTAYLFCG